MSSFKSTHNVAIIGGGISGLFAGYLLLEKGYRVTIFEKESALGGILATFKIDNNIYVDSLYHHIFPQNRILLSLISKLGLKNELIWRKNQTGVIIDNVLLPLNSFSDLLKVYNLPLIDKYRFITFFLKTLFITKWRKWDAISVHDLVERNCGREIWKNIFYPPLKAKFCSFANSISAAWFYKKLQQKIKCRTARSGERLGAFKKSSKILVDCVAEKIREKGGKIFTESRVKQVLIKDLCFEGLNVNNENYGFDSVIVTTPIPELVKLLPSDLKEVSDSIIPLKSIEYVHSLCTLIRLKKGFSKFYWLFVYDERSPFSLIIDHTNFINPSDYNGEHIVYLARYVDSREQLHSKPDKELFNNDFLHLKMLFPQINDSDIIDYYITRASYAQPVFKTNYLTLMPEPKFSVKGMYILNTSQLFPLQRTINGNLMLAKQCIDDWY